MADTYIMSELTLKKLTYRNGNAVPTCWACGKPLEVGQTVVRKDRVLSFTRPPRKIHAKHYHVTCYEALHL